MDFFASFLAVADTASSHVGAAGDLAKIKSIGESFNYFHSLGSRAADWFSREQFNLLSMCIGIALTILLMFLARCLMQGIFLKIARRTPGSLGEEIVVKLSAPTQFVVLVVGLAGCNTLVHFPGNMDHWLTKFFYACFIIAFLWGIFRIIAVFDFHFRRKVENSRQKMNMLLVDMLRKTAKVAVWVLAAIFIAQNVFNLNVTALVTGAGVAGLAIAFAAQNTIANLFGAMSIISDKTFKVGDRVTIGEANGSVEAVGLRSTRLRSLDGTVWNVPNRIAADSTIENITERPYIKYAFAIGLIYSTTPEQMRRALAILDEILGANPVFNHESFPPLYFFTDFKAYSLDISVTLWFQTTDYVQYLRWKQQINFAILEKFNAAGLEFAFPTSTNYLINQGVS